MEWNPSLEEMKNSSSSLSNFSHPIAQSPRQNCILLDNIVLLLNTQILSNYKDTPQCLKHTDRTRMPGRTAGRRDKTKAAAKFQRFLTLLATSSAS